MRHVRGALQYLLIGSKEALLIDTDDVADPKQMPLAKMVVRLVPAMARQSFRCWWSIRIATLTIARAIP